MISAADLLPQPPDISNVNVISGRDTQVNTRSFGDIDLQFQNSLVTAQILNDHISNQGSNRHHQHQDRSEQHDHEHGVDDRP